MEHSSLVSNLSLINYPENEWFRPSTLNNIIMESDNNIYFNPKLEKIKFDTTNDLIMLKYSILKNASSILKKFQYNSTKNFIKIYTPFGSVYGTKTCREPKVGDKVFSYDKVLKEYAYSVISNIVINQNYTYIYFEDENLINKILSAKNGLTFFVVLGSVDININAVILDVPYEIFIENNITQYEADVFIGLDRVAGFDFNKSWN